MSTTAVSIIISQYVLSAWMLGAEFGGAPTAQILSDTTATIIADLADHGYIVVSSSPTTDTAT